jgi:hypothetical protein
MRNDRSPIPRSSFLPTRRQARNQNSRKKTGYFSGISVAGCAGAWSIPSPRVMHSSLASLLCRKIAAIPARAQRGTFMINDGLRHPHQLVGRAVEGSRIAQMWQSQARPGGSPSHMHQPGSEVRSRGETAVRLERDTL